MSDATNDGDEEYYPEFSTVRHGYDPDEVEAVLDDLYASLSDAVREADEHAAELIGARSEREQLTAALAEARRRIADLERRPAAGPGSFDNIGSRVDDILSAAAAEAAEITRRAREKALAVQGEAEAASVARRAEADEYASGTRHRADAEAAGLIADARAEAERIVVEAKAAAAELAGAQDRAAAEAQGLLAGAHREAEGVRTEARRVREEAREHRALVRAQLAEIRERVARALAVDDGPGVEPDGPTTTLAHEVDADVRSGPHPSRLSDVSDDGVRR